MTNFVVKHVRHAGLMSAFECYFDCAHCQSLFRVRRKRKQERFKDLIMERRNPISCHGAPFVLLRTLRGSGVIAESITEMRINYIMSKLINADLSIVRQSQAAGTTEKRRKSSFHHPLAVHLSSNRRNPINISCFNAPS